MRPHVVEWLDGFLPWNIAALVAPSWFTCVGLAGVVSLLAMIAIGRRHRIDTNAIASIVVWAYVAAVVAGIVMPIFVDMVHQKITTGQVRVRWAGMTSFWGYLAGFAAVVIVCRDHKIPLGQFGDLAAAPLGLALVFARLGCFLGGCDYGKVTNLPWAVRFPSGSPAWHSHVDDGLVPASRIASLPVHPTQLYEALLGIVIAIVVIWAGRQPWAKAKVGRVGLLGIALYATGRIGIETLRADVGRGIYFGLSSGQIFSICVLAAIAVAPLVQRRRVVEVVASTVLVLAILGTTRLAEAQQPPQPAPQPPSQPQPPQQGYPRPSPQPYPQQQPYPQPQPDPPQPYPQQPQPYPQQPQPYPQQPQPYPQQPYPAPGPPAAYPAPAPQRPQGPSEPSDRRVEAGVLFGFATPINRRPEQVSALAGPSLSLGYLFGRAGLWLDFDSLGNRDASHGTLLVSGSIVTGVNDRLSVGGRVGIGATLVNFDEPAFGDVSGTSLRFESIADYAMGESWAVWARPLSFDILTASELGGPITTWQMRIGVAYRFGARKQRAQLQPQQPVHQQPPPRPQPAVTP